MIPDFDKMPGGLLPAIIQDAGSNAVLMLGYMNQEAFERTLRESVVWFYSRSKGRLWLKGERSGNVLDFVSARLDCDRDALLVSVRPRGPVCHTGDETCFGAADGEPSLPRLEATIARRRLEGGSGSYVAGLFGKGINAIAQKVGEEAVELIIEAKDDDAERFRNEAADLLFHYLVLLQAKGLRLADVERTLEERRR